MASSTRRAVVTGLGIVSPIGLGGEAVWDSIANLRGGVRPVTAFDASGLPIRFAGVIPEFDVNAFIDKQDKNGRKSTKLMARSIRLAVAAAYLAVKDAKLTPGSFDPPRVGVEFGAGLIATELGELAKAASVSSNCQPNMVDLEKWGDHGIGQMPPLWMLKYLPNMLACHVSILHDAQGPNNTVIEDDVASLLAIGESYRIITRDHADAMIVGGADSKINPVSFVRQCLIQSLSRRNEDPARASRPFDRARDGMVLGEGGGVMILEEREHALRRGARVYAELVGFGSAFDRKRTGAGLARAIRAALAEAGITPDDIDHVNAHGLSTRTEDVWEARGIAEALGGRRTESGAPAVPVFAGKSYFGNMGAGGGVGELIVSLLGLGRGRTPTSINFDEPDPDCPLAVLTGAPRPVERPCILKLSFTPAGQCAALVFRRPD